MVDKVLQTPKIAKVTPLAESKTESSSNNHNEQLPKNVKNEVASLNLNNINNTESPELKINFSLIKKVTEQVDVNIDAMILLLREEIKRDPLNTHHLFITIQEFTEFQKGLKESTEYLAKSSEKLIGSPIRTLADNMAEEIRKNSYLGKLAEFVTESTDKIKEKLKTLGDNKILKAAWEVLATGCNVIKIAIAGMLNNAIASGQFGQAVANLGIAVKETTVGRKQSAGLQR